MKRKLVAIMVTLTLVLTLLPAMAFAAGDGGASWTLKRGFSDLGDVFYYESDYPADLDVWVEVKEGSSLKDPVFNYSLYKKGSDKILKSGTLKRDEYGYYSKVFQVSTTGTYICEVTLNNKKSTAQRVQFEVANMDPDPIEKATVTGITSQVYTGSLIKPAPVVKLKGKTLKSGEDYTVSYKKCKYVGKATVTIKGINDYYGTITKTFKINPRPTEIAKTSKLSKGFKVQWKKRTTQNTGYQLQYATDQSFTKNEKTITFKSNTTTSKKVTGLTGGKKYYYRVRCYKTVNGVKYYSKWTPRKYVITKK